LDSSKIEESFGELGTLDSINPKGIPEKEGLVEVLEDDRYLYISRNENLHAVVNQFVSGSTLKMMGNEFWTPKRDSIRMRVFFGSAFLQTSLGRWQLRLIHDRKPVFNWPVSDEAA
jgi:hypothetical protein